MQPSNTDLSKVFRLNTISGDIYHILENGLTGKNWAIKTTLFASIISLFFAFPSYQSMIDYLQSGRAVQVSLQIKDLISFWQVYNGENTVFRLTVPLIASFLGLDIMGAYILQFAAGIALFYFTARFIERETQDRVIAFLLSIATACMFAGSTSFVEFRATYDGVAILLLVTAIWFKSPAVIALSIYLATFTDERAIIAAGFAYLYWVILHNREGFSFRSLFNIQSLSVVFAVGAHFLTRIILKHTFGLITWTESKSEFLFFDQVNNIPMGLWTGLEAAWIFILIALAWLIHQKKWLFFIIFTGLILVQAIIAVSIVDITRSMAYLFPSFLIAIAVISHTKKEQLRHLALATALINIIALNYYAGGKSTIWLFYPLPIQVIRWIIGT